jgi:hypothetical protein
MILHKRIYNGVLTSLQRSQVSSLPLSCGTNHAPIQFKIRKPKQAVFRDRPFRFRNAKPDVIRVKVRHSLILACIVSPRQTHDPTASQSRTAI